MPRPQGRRPKSAVKPTIKSLSVEKLLRGLEAKGDFSPPETSRRHPPQLHPPQLHPSQLSPPKGPSEPRRRWETLHPEAPLYPFQVIIPSASKAINQSRSVPAPARRAPAKMGHRPSAVVLQAPAKRAVAKSLVAKRAPRPRKRPAQPPK
jgi:hypothetical protein